MRVICSSPIKLKHNIYFQATVLGQGVTIIKKLFTIQSFEIAVQT